MPPASSPLPEPPAAALLSEAYPDLDRLRAERDDLTLLARDRAQVRAEQAYRPATRAR